MNCYYHNRDLDGYCSGAIMKRKFPNAKIIGYDYGLPLEIPVGIPIIMADVSLPMPTMFKIAQASGFNFTWIDHHVSAINEYKEFAKGKTDFLKPVLEEGFAACEIAWQYFFPDEDTPIAVTLLGEYDTWRRANQDHWDNFILPFQYGMRQICNSLDTFPMHLLQPGSHREQVDEIIKAGKLILRYQSQQDEYQCRIASFECEFEGLRAICLNGGGFNSNTFDSVYDESKHDVMMPFQWKKGQWAISIYTTKDDIDCSDIAKSNGGGGHKKAAGFQVDDIYSVFPEMKKVI